MQYRNDKYGNPISILGFGCMRFPQTAGRINMEETQRQIVAAVEKGVNYFDTAYIYGGSEAALGEILAKNNLRDKVNIATKLPHYLIKSAEGMEKYFQEQLKRLQTDHIDYYLMHMLTDTATWQRLIDLGILQWLEEKKSSGQIRQVGFSYHGNTTMFCQLIDAYDWDFCQIQYNYMDETTQAGRDGLHHAANKGIPVIIMEPLRGGRLVNKLPQEAKQLMADFVPHHTPAQWAFRWLWSQPQVTCVLSGMNSMDMLEDNVSTACDVRIGEIGEKETQLLHEVSAAINRRMKVGCTGCGYCMPCPKGVDIRGTFAAWNRSASEGRIAGMQEYLMNTGLRKQSTAASNCIGCGKCEQHCPQHIEIRKQLKLAQKDLEGVPFRVARWFIRKLRAY